MAVIQETIIAGKIILVKKINRKSIRRGEKREKRKNVTSEEVEKINRRNSEKTLTIKVHHNFSEGDFHHTLTHEGVEPSLAEANNRLNKFKSNVRNWAKKNKVEFKWVLVTEWLNKRVHHHIIVNKEIPIEIINKYWHHGFVRSVMFDHTGDYRKLCSYLMKETDKTFRMDDCPTKKRFSCSRNLEMPPVFREEINPVEMLKEPKPIRGYYIDKDSLWEGVNPLTGQLCMEYVMLPLENTKPKKWLKNKKKKKYRQENYNRYLEKIATKQLELDLPF